MCFPHQPGLPYASFPKAETPPVFCSYFVGTSISDGFSVCLLIIFFFNIRKCWMAKHSSKMSKMFSFLEIFSKCWSGLIRLEWFLHHFLYPLNLRVTFNDIPPRAYRILKQSVFSLSTIVRRKLIQFMLHTRSRSEFYIYVIKLRICNLIFPHVYYATSHLKITFFIIFYM